MNKTEIYDKVDTILNINNENYENDANFPYKKGQKLYEKHFFEDIYECNNINTHYSIPILEEYEAYLKIIGDYLIQLINNNIYKEKEFNINFFDNYLSSNFKSSNFYSDIRVHRCSIRYHDDAKISYFWKPSYYKSIELCKTVKNIGYGKTGMKYILKYISGTPDALNGKIDIANFTVTESTYDIFDNVIKYSSNKHYKGIYTMSAATLESELEYKRKMLKEKEMSEKQDKSLFWKIIRLFIKKNRIINEYKP